jgi:hypothetical protein
MRHGGHNFDIVGGHDHCPTFDGKTFEHGDESLLGAVIETAGRFIEQHECRFGTEHDGERKGEALTLGEIPGMGALVDADLAKESAKLQSLQIRQQLGTQALGIANQAPQSLLSLFR